MPASRVPSRRVATIDHRSEIRDLSARLTTEVYTEIFRDIVELAIYYDIIRHADVYITVMMRRIPLMITYAVLDNDAFCVVARWLVYVYTESRRDAIF